jgi:mono/diheme cytochrome c family protein
MATEASSPNPVAVLSGVAAGIITFASLMVWYGRPFIPTTEDLPNILKEPPPSAAAAVVVPAGPTDPGEQVFQTCAACHQANAMGLPGAFPPLAGSEWVSADPETPIRVVLYGLSGPITVKGATFNSMMPPPPGLDDKKISLVLTHVRSHFGNTASAISEAQVAAVRSAIGARSKPFTADELQALRPAAGAAAPAAAAAPAGEPAAKHPGEPAKHPGEPAAKHPGEPSAKPAAKP